MNEPDYKALYEDAKAELSAYQRIHEHLYREEQHKRTEAEMAHSCAGMELRELQARFDAYRADVRRDFVKAAMQGICARGHSGSSEEHAYMAIVMADATLKEMEK